MPVYTEQSTEDDHEHYPDTESAEHIHYGTDDEVCIVTLHEDGPSEDEDYDGEPYECEYCGEEVDYDDKAQETEEEEQRDEEEVEEEEQEDSS